MPATMHALPFEIPTLTPMEEQVIEIFRIRNIEYLESGWSTDVGFAVPSFIDKGRNLFGPEWGGRGIKGNGSSWINYPLMNSFLGRLRRKGLIERIDGGATSASFNRSFGFWRLTAQGRKILGLPS